MVEKLYVTYNQVITLCATEISFQMLVQPNYIAQIIPEL